MCIKCAKEVIGILDQMEEAGEWKGLSDDEIEVQRQIMGMRLRSNLICPQEKPDG